MHAAMILESVAWSNASASTKDCGPARTPRVARPPRMHPQSPTTSPRVKVATVWRPLITIATPSRRTNSSLLVE